MTQNSPATLRTLLRSSAAKATTCTDYMSRLVDQPDDYYVGGDELRKHFRIFAALARPASADLSDLELVKTTPAQDYFCFKTEFQTGHVAQVLLMGCEMNRLQKLADQAHNQALDHIQFPPVEDIANDSKLELPSKQAICVVLQVTAQAKSNTHVNSVTL